jgi:hypothetical protein
LYIGNYQLPALLQSNNASLPAAPFDESIFSFGDEAGIIFL